MFKEFVERSTHIPKAERLNMQELQTETAKTFDGLVDFLRDPKEFPNHEVNKLVTLMWRVIGNKFIPITIDTKGSLSHFAFIEIKHGGIESGAFILPREFVDWVREDIAKQTGAIVYMGSLARDFYTHHENSDTDRHTRASAFEADMLLTIQDLARTENQSIHINQSQQQMLSRYPLGLKSLDNRLNYPTPTHIGGFRF